MKKYQTLALTLVVSIIVAGVLLVPTVRGAREEISAAPAIGATIADFSLPDTSGKEHLLSTLEGKNGTVIVFVSAQCPVVKAYNERMAKLAEDYSARGIKVIAINSNSTESLDQMKSHAADNKLTFVMLRDKGNKIADKLGAQVTPEAFVLDSNNKLVYHGRIDNARNPANITANDLRDAIEAMLAGKPVAKSEVSAFGCSIKRAS